MGCVRVCGVCERSAVGCNGSCVLWYRSVGEGQHTPLSTQLYSTPLSTPLSTPTYLIESTDLGLCEGRVEGPLDVVQRGVGHFVAVGQAEGAGVVQVHENEVTALDGVGVGGGGLASTLGGYGWWGV